MRRHLCVHLVYLKVIRKINYLSDIGNEQLKARVDLFTGRCISRWMSSVIPIGSNHFKYAREGDFQTVDKFLRQLLFNGNNTFQEFIILALNE
jgi:hypothetical protein